MPDPDFELFFIFFLFYCHNPTHHHITMLYCDLNLSFHQCIKSYPNIQVSYPNIQISYPDIEMS